MHIPRALAALAVAIFMTASACNKQANPIVNDPVLIENVSAVAKMNQVLGWRIFDQEQMQKPDQNVLISPLSIQTAVYMALNGAGGQTLDELLGLMDCTGCDLEGINTHHRDLTTLLATQSGHPTLTLANRFFYDGNRMAPKAPFLQTIGTYYNAGNQNLDFRNVPTSLATINGWVKDNTNQKIDAILEEIRSTDAAFLINALHFKADWAKGFEPQSTHQAPFTKPNGTQVNVPLMMADRDFMVSQTPGFNLVDIPLRDSTFSISLVQPSEANTNPQWHLGITHEAWRAMYDNMQYGRAIVFVPKLKMAYDNDLIPSMRALGVSAPFDEVTADFRDLGTAMRNIFIGQIRHKAIIEMDEKGVEGAAVTSIGFVVTSAPPMFRFDSPFIFTLRHIPTNTLLFMGFVADPT